ncbi:MAG: hypothetical protein EBZ48_03655 [Proteobacteria bacterium]|nr:hypothetical protein [Pseudomonadota bacterium]
MSAHSVVFLLHLNAAHLARHAIWSENCFCCALLLKFLKKYGVSLKADIPLPGNGFNSAQCGKGEIMNLRSTILLSIPLLVSAIDTTPAVAQTSATLKVCLNSTSGAIVAPVQKG